ncbi:cell division protein SepF [Alloscardovia theropitheci]|uniref:Cell division protein SepF n=1 Tax=Alloscardovia theropitheci TaxID=2496842 RepID=A0A4R0QWU9_9BIFI|nr:cell division protein SepF [Alloscardovia theropitheci]TCD54000.1 cell division protein SepF [Alloscardovia theropitheci]
MPSVFNRGLSFFGLADPEEAEDESMDVAESADTNETDFDRDDSLSVQSSRLAAAGRGNSASNSTAFPKSAMNRITTIHPRNYNEVESVGRALRDGTPVVLNLTGVADRDAQRIVDFATGVVFGVRGSVERVTPRVWLLSPAAVSIRPEQSETNPTSGLFE